MQTLQVTVTIRHDCPVVGVAGEVDMTTVAQLRAAIDRGMVPNEPLVLDLTRVAFLDASGLRTLLGASGDAVERGDSLRIVPSEAVRRVIDLAGVAERLDSFPDTRAAVDGTAGTDNSDGINATDRLNATDGTAQHTRTIAPGPYRPDWSRTC